MIKTIFYGRYVEPVTVYFPTLTGALDWVNWMTIQRHANPMDFEQHLHTMTLVSRTDPRYIIAEFSQVEIQEI